jgi:FkbM family methyltransferase
MKFAIFTFIKFHHFIKTQFGINLKGLGRVQRYLRNDFTFKAFNKNFYYSHEIEGSYDYLLIGKSNEPETHLFLNSIIPKMESVNFIDVGASVGEFVLSITNYFNVNNIFAFEPRTSCAKVLLKNIELNREDRITVYEFAASDKEGIINFNLNKGGSSAGFYSQSSSTINRLEVRTVLLDKVLPKLLKNTILLVDVEGAEPLVLSGGKEFIDRNKPLIIFEYNNTSKRHFDLSDIKRIIGDTYSIYRIKHDGSLDQDFTNSWNCVAISSNSNFQEVLLPASLNA